MVLEEELKSNHNTVNVPRNAGHRVAIHIHSALPRLKDWASCTAQQLSGQP